MNNLLKKNTMQATLKFPVLGYVDIWLIEKH